MPFLRLTRDRRGFENTFLLHAANPGERPRLLYWYRTAPGIVLGRSPLDEDAIRTLEEQHPEIDFDWRAILALGEAMIHEDEAPVRPQKRGRQEQQPRRQREQPREARQPEATVIDEGVAQDDLEPTEVEPLTAFDEIEDEPMVDPPLPPTAHGLLEELVGREIATRLRARHAEISARIHEAVAEPAARDAWERRADSLNPDTWLTPAAILEGVRQADKLFEALREELPGHH